MTLICVTGAAGRVGSALVPRLASAGHEVRCLVRPGGRPVAPLPNVEIVEADLTDGRALESAVHDADVVIHLAAQMVLGDTSVEQYYDTNVMGTLRLLEAAVNQPRAIRRFVYASTDNTYGPGAPAVRFCDEGHDRFPGDYYGTAKVLCEELVRNYSKIHSLEFTILRYGSVVAPNETVSLFRLSWLRQFLATHRSAGRRGNLWPFFSQGHDFERYLPEPNASADCAVAVVGPGEEPWSLHLTDVRDAVEGTMKCWDNPAAVNEVFNIVGPRTTSFVEGAEVVARHAGLSRAILRMPDTLAFEISHAKAKRLLHYHPEHDFESTYTTGVQETEPVRASAG